MDSLDACYVIVSGVVPGAIAAAQWLTERRNRRRAALAAVSMAVSLWASEEPLLGAPAGPPTDEPRLPAPHRLARVSHLPVRTRPGTGVPPHELPRPEQPPRSPSGPGAVRRPGARPAARWSRPGPPRR